jgi:hypothetical protein
MNSYTHLSLGDMILAHAKNISITSEPPVLALESRAVTRQARTKELKICASARKAARELAAVQRRQQERLLDAETKSELAVNLNNRSKKRFVKLFGVGVFK